MQQNPQAEQRSMRFDGYKTRYWFYDIDTQRKPLLVMVHGFRGDHHGLQLIADRLRDRYHVVVPDLPGFGRSEPFPQGPHDIPHYVGFLRRFITELTDGAVHPQGERGVLLLGHSFGSVIASHLAAEHPAMVEQLLLLNPICEPALSAQDAAATKAADAYYTLAMRLPKAMGERLLRSHAVSDLMSREMTASQDPQLRSYVENQHRAYFGSFADRRVVAEAYRASISGTVAEVAPLLSMPVLLVVGAQDPLGSVEAQERMATWIRRRRLVILDDVGHLIHYEKPLETAELIHEFVQGPDPEPIDVHDELPPIDQARPNTSQFTQLLPIVRRGRR